MKKAVLIMALFLSQACEKDPIQECVQCTEANSGYTADKFCGDPIAVKKYEDNLKSLGGAGQHWSCKNVK